MATQPGSHARVILPLLEEIADRDAQIEALQARIDELMLEYCPDEMTQEQIERWKQCQGMA